MNKLLTFLSFTILTFSLISCQKNKEEDFFQKRYDTNNIDIITLVSTDSTYSPHVDVEKLYRITHSNLNEENFDTLFNQYLTIRRNFVNPPFNNCIKKNYAIKINGGEVKIHSIYYVNHRGAVCMHDKEMIMKQLIDIDHNFYYFTKNKKPFKIQVLNDTCVIHNEFN